MAERRMFAKTIVLSDAFLDMPLSARCLYFTLGMFADDDGFVNAPKSIMRQCGSSEDDMRLLGTKKFVLVFPDGILVIKHWRINNYLRSDRYAETKYLEDKSLLTVDANGTYHLNDGIPSGIPMVDQRYTQCSIGEDSIGKDSREREYSEVSPSPDAKGTYGIYNNVKLTQSDLDSLKKDFPFEFGTMIDHLSTQIHIHGYKYKDHAAVIRKWREEDKNKKKSPSGTVATKSAIAYNHRYKQREYSAEEMKAIEDSLYREIGENA